MSSPYHQAELYLIPRDRIVPAGYPAREDQSGGNNTDPSFVDKLVGRPDLSHHAQRVCCHLRSGAPTPGIECRTTSSTASGPCRGRTRPARPAGRGGRSLTRRSGADMCGRLRRRARARGGARVAQQSRLRTPRSGVIIWQSGLHCRDPNAHDRVGRRFAIVS
jgi:hypothetical protein